MAAVTARLVGGERSSGALRPASMRIVAVDAGHRALLELVSVGALEFGPRGRVAGGAHLIYFRVALRRARLVHGSLRHVLRERNRGQQGGHGLESLRSMDAVAGSACHLIPRVASEDPSCHGRALI